MNSPSANERYFSRREPPPFSLGDLSGIADIPENVLLSQREVDPDEDEEPQEPDLVDVIPTQNDTETPVTTPESSDIADSDSDSDGDGDGDGVGIGGSLNDLD